MDASLKKKKKEIGRQRQRHLSVDQFTVISAVKHGFKEYNNYTNINTIKIPIRLKTTIRFPLKVCPNKRSPTIREKYEDVSLIFVRLNKWRSISKTNGVHCKGTEEVSVNKRILTNSNNMLLGPLSPRIYYCNKTTIVLLESSVCGEIVPAPAPCYLLDYIQR